VNTIEFLEKTPLKVEDLLSIVKNDSFSNINQFKNYLLKIQNDKNAIEALYKEGKISSKNIEKEILKIETVQKELKEISKQIKEEKYLPSDYKKLFNNIVKNISNVKDFEILKPLLNTYKEDTKAIVKVLSSLKNSIDSTTKISLFEKEKYNTKLKQIISDFKEQGVLTPEIISEIKQLKKILESAKTEKGENIFEIEDNDKITTLLDKQLENSVLSRQYDRILELIENFTRENKLENTKEYKQLLDGTLTIEDYLGKIYEEFKNNKKIQEEIRNLDQEINKKFEKQTLLFDTITETLNKDHELSKTEIEYIQQLLNQYENKSIDKETFYKKISLLTKNPEIEVLLKEQLIKTEELIENGKLTNKQKILEERRFELLEDSTKQIAELTNALQVKDNPSILKSVTEASSIEEASFNVTSKLLDSVFGEGTLAEKIIEKIIKKLKIDKLGGILLKGGKGFFSKLLNIVSRPLMGMMRGGTGLLARGAGALMPSIASATTGALSATGTVLSSAGSFLLTNPVGWGILAIGAVGAIGYGVYKWKYGKDRELIDALEEQGVLEHHYIGDTEIKDWSRLLMLKDSQFKTLIHFDDWSKEDENLIKTFAKVSEDTRYIIANILHRGEGEIKNGKLYLTKEGIKLLLSQSDSISEQDFKLIISILDDKSKNLLEKQAFKENNNKVNNLIVEDKKLEKWNKKKKPKSVKDVYKLAIKQMANLSPIANTTKSFQYLFGDDKYKLIQKLEDESVLVHNVFGDSEIVDWKKIDQLSPKQIKQLIDFNDWDKDTLEKLQELYKEKLKKQSNSQTSIDSKAQVILDNYYNQGIRDLPNLIAASNLDAKTVKTYLAKKQSNQSKATFSVNIDTNKNTSNEKNTQSQQSIVVQNYYNQNSEPVRFVDKSNEFLANRN